MIEIVIIGSTIRHGAKLVGPGSRIVVTEPVAIAFVNAGRARYHIETPPVEPPPAEPPLALAETVPDVIAKAPASPPDNTKTKRHKR